MAESFAGEDLRGRSFVNQDLSGVEFRAADLRGASFRGANLRGADFREARAGVSGGRRAVIVALAFAFSIAIGVAAGRAGEYLHDLIRGDSDRRRLLGAILAIELLVFIAVSVWKGLRVAVRYVLPRVVAIAIVAFVVALLTGAGTGKGALALLAFAVLTAAIVALGSLARAVAGTTSTLLFAVVAISGALSSSLTGGGVAATVIAVGSMLIGRRALEGREPGQLGRLSAILASRGGTSFRGADLSGATFESARLESTDFRGARLDGARLDRAQARSCVFDRGAQSPA